MVDEYMEISIYIDTAVLYAIGGQEATETVSMMKIAK